jgi:hypothetical protein
VLGRLLPSEDKEIKINSKKTGSAFVGTGTVNGPNLYAELLNG